MKLAYSTYGLQTVDPLKAIRRVKDMGYEALELNIGDEWPTAPTKLDQDDRARLCGAFEEAGFPSPVLMNLIHLCAAGEDVVAKSKAFAESCRLAVDLNFDGRSPVVTTTLGGQIGGWEEVREDLAKRLETYAEVAEDHGTVIAVEAHVGQLLDSPEKVVWLVETMGRPSIRLNFDHSHFHVLGMDLKHCVSMCAPYAVHTHIKDGRMVEGKVEFQLPGEGSLNLVDYFREMQSAGIEVPITVEVSAQIWKRPDYEPWLVAEKCFSYLDRARSQVA